MRCSDRMTSGQKSHRHAVTCFMMTGLLSKQVLLFVIILFVIVFGARLVRR